jgi:hypothetical protein
MLCFCTISDSSVGSALVYCAASSCSVLLYIFPFFITVCTMAMEESQISFIF